MFCDPCGDIFSNNIELYINFLSGGEGLEVGMFPGIGNNGHGEGVCLRSDDGEADSIDANGSFVYYYLFGRVGELKVKIPGSAGCLYFFTEGEGINMALNKVPVYTIVQGQAAFKINQVVYFPVG